MIKINLELFSLITLTMVNLVFVVNKQICIGRGNNLNVAMYS